jgi:ribonucleoside-diphosphate reductase alpha chain
MELDSTTTPQPQTNHNIASTEAGQSQSFQNAQPGVFYVIRRNGKLTAFDASKIAVAVTKAFLAVEGGNAAASSRIHDTVNQLADEIVSALTRRMPAGGTVHIEDIQDQVELALMRSGEHKVARAYVLYRNDRALARKKDEKKDESTHAIHVIDVHGNKKPLDEKRINDLVTESCADLEEVSVQTIIDETMKNLFDGVQEKDITQALIMSARTLIEQEPNYSLVAARLLLDALRSEALVFLDMDVTSAQHFEMHELYPAYFKKYLQAGIDLELLDPKLTQFDLDRICQAFTPDRDLQFNYLGLQTLYDRYFIHTDDTRIELPQAFFMRVSMGLAMNEIDREEKAIEFYHLLSSFNFMSSTPTLFNSATLRPQLSSCYLTTVPDELDGIYGAMRDNALLSKYAGGLGNDWTRVRAMGAHIKGTNGKSQGVVPFLKVANDTAVAVNQGGKRKGAVCAYLETWHLDIEEFLELRKNTGDERRRTHDMNTANWIPDLFMKRVQENKEWTLFSPHDVADLHDLYGSEFDQAYAEYEAKAESGEIKLFKKVSALDMWRKMLTLLFETGHPWITFKDPCNIRSPQQHVGSIHSSNLCTEITLNTSNDEIAVCNLGSVNLPQHITDGELDQAKLERTIRTAMRMLDNVIDINYYSVPQARRSNLRHRPVGIGIMGFQDALYQKGIAYGSEQAVYFADESMEKVSYCAIKASAELAQERGAYQTYQGSLWSQGILPIDSMQMLKDYRQETMEADQSSTLDWDSLRQIIKQHGMRNSNCMAIAPTATISNICGVSQSIEPTYQNLFVKSNLSGEFTVVNPYLVRELKKLNLWDEVMVNDLKYYDGSIAQIDRIPGELKSLYGTAFEIDPRWLVEAASRRQKWIDQAQSLNLYMSEPSGKKLDDLYQLAWKRGLKTTYYLRSLGATAAEKTTITDGALNAVQPQNTVQACSINDPDCEACQ